MSFSSNRPQRRAGVDLTGDAALLIALYAFEASALVAALAINRYYNILGTLTMRQAAALWIPVVLCLASGVFVALWFVRAVSSEYRQVTFALILNLVGVVLGFVTAEVLVRTFSVSMPTGEWFAGTLLLPKDWDDIRARHKEALAQLPPELSYLVTDDLLGWVPGRSRQSSDGLYASSEEGIRSSSAGIVYGTRAAEQWVAIVGDSFTFGLEVPFESSWGAVLERMLGPNVAVLNFGVDGYGVDQAVLRYERDARPWKPDVSILGFIEHDLLRSLSVYSFVTFPEWGFPFSKPRFVLEGGVLKRLTDRLEGPTRILAEPSIGNLPLIAYDPGYEPEEWDHHVSDASYALRFLRSRFRRWPPPNAETPDAELGPLNTALLSRFIRIAEVDGAIPLIVFFPARSDFTGESHPGRDAVLAALLRAGVEYIDLRSCVGAVGVENAFIPNRPHYSAAGNAAVAQCLSPVVRQALTRD
jgi:hypothetical protein